MAIPNEKLQSVLREIESKAAFAQQQLQIVRSQIQSKTREKRMLHLSAGELDALPRETPVYDGVGKMFVLTSIADVKEVQSKQSADADKEMDNLNKKLHYLETTNKNANEHMARILGAGGS